MNKNVLLESLKETIITLWSIIKIASVCGVFISTICWGASGKPWCFIAWILLAIETFCLMWYIIYQSTKRGD